MSPLCRPPRDKRPREATRPRDLHVRRIVVSDENGQTYNVLILRGSLAAAVALRQSSHCLRDPE